MKITIEIQIARDHPGWYVMSQTVHRVVWLLLDRMSSGEFFTDYSGHEEVMPGALATWKAKVVK